LPHVAKTTESLNDRLTSSDTNLQSSIDLGTLGQRFARRSAAGDQGGGNPNPANFTPPITVVGTNDPTNLAATQGGGTFSLKSGTVFSNSSSDNVALVGSALASKNNLSAGSTFTAYGVTIKVVGLFDSGNQFSNGLVVMPLATVQTLSVQAADLTSATVTVDSVDNLSTVTTAIKNVLGSAADVTNAQDQANNAVAPLENIKSISLYSLIGAVIAGAVIILLTMIMIVRERRREIGVLKAIGASNLKVVGQFMSEAVTFTALAAVIGIALGVVAANPITTALVKNSSTTATATGAVTGAPGGGRLAFRLGGGVRQSITNIHASVGWDIILYGLGAALVIALTGSAVASWFIAKVRPAEVMRSE
jgi:putative ABC transport system permease protein